MPKKPSNLELPDVRRVPLESIKIIDRERTILGDLTGLANSIQTEGLLHFPVVCEDGDCFRLLAGERRIRAIEALKWPTCPVHVVKADANSAEIEAIELAENLHRLAFTPAETARLTRRIHQKMMLANGVDPTQVNYCSGWTIKDTANMLNVSETTIQRHLKEADAIDLFPELERAETHNEIDNSIRRLQNRMHVMQAMQNNVFEEDQAKRYLSDAYYVGDFFKLVQKVPNESVDFIELDPPYAIDVLSSRKSRPAEQNYGASSMYNEIEASEYVRFLKRTFAECYRTLRDSCWMIVWFSNEPWQEIVFNELQLAGFLGTRTPGIWVKPNGICNSPDYHLACATDQFYYVRKGGAMLKRPARLNTFYAQTIPSQQRIHVTERPVELLKEILTTFCLESSRIMVPFLGSGNTLFAAQECGMSGFGYELESELKLAFLRRVAEREFANA